MGEQDGGGKDPARNDQRQDAPDLLVLLLDGLATRVALVGGDGRIVKTNAPWRAMQPGLGGLDCGVGDDLVAALAAEPAASEGADLAGAIREVLDGTADEHSRVLPAEAGDDGRWDLVAVRAVSAPSGRLAVISYDEITDRIRANQALRRSEEELRRYRSHLEELVGDRTADLEASNARLTREVADRRRAEQALSESEQKFRTLTEQTSAGIFINRADQLLYANAGVAEICGYSPEELRTMSLWDLVREDYRQEVGRRAEARLRGEAVESRFEVPILTKRGAERWVEISAAIIEFAGAAATLATCFDITDRRRAEDERQRLERQMLHTQKLESLGVLAGGIAHDFNNLLVSMLGNASLALEQLAPDSGALYSVAQIERAAVRASELTNQLLAYAGKGTLRREAVDCTALVSEMTQLLETAVGRRATLVFGCEPDIPPIEADPGQLRQVVMNLITNAADAVGEQGGTITVRTGRSDTTREQLGQAVTATPLAPGPMVYVEVADTGTGMDPITRTRIFDPFFTTKPSGHGLGLAAVLGIVRNHHGAVLVQSTPAVGTTFRVLLPLQRSPIDAVPQPPETAAGGWRGTGTVLVVDDEPEVREVAEAMLRRRGFDVLTATDGHDAVATLSEHLGDIACVVLDLEMPNLGGEAAFHALRAVRADVPIIISTGYSNHASLEAIRRDPRTGLLPKPYSAAQLAAAIRQVLATV